MLCYDFHAILAGMESTALQIILYGIYAFCIPPTQNKQKEGAAPAVVSLVIVLFPLRLLRLNLHHKVIDLQVVALVHVHSYDFTAARS